MEDVARVVGGEVGEAEEVTLPNGRILSGREVKMIDALGPTEDVFEAQQNPRKLPPPIIDGMLLQQEFATLTSDSKARKSFFLILMALCVACGYPFFGLKTFSLPVLYLNFELFPGAVDWRIAQALKALFALYGKIYGERFKPGLFRAWQLRGKKGLTLDNLADSILYRAWKEAFTPGLVILDPAYKLWQGKDEISSGDMGDAYGKLANLPAELGACVVACLHAPKGNNDKRRGLDLYSGSGVGGRNVDSAIALRIKHADLDADPSPLTRVEVTRRHLASPSPFCIRWSAEKNVLEFTDEAWGKSGGQSGDKAAANTGEAPKAGPQGFNWIDLFSNPDTRLTSRELKDKFLLASGKRAESTAESWIGKEVKKAGGLLSKSGTGAGTRYFLSPTGRARRAERNPEEAATAGDLPLATGTDAAGQGEGAAT